MIATHTAPLVALLALALPLQDPQEPDVFGVPESVHMAQERARVPFTLDDRRPVPVVEARVNGRGPFRFFYDTGASVCVLDYGFVEELGIPLGEEAEIGDHTQSARLPAHRVRMDSLELEGLRFEGVGAVAFDRSKLRGDVIRGVLGLPLFRGHLLTLDYARGRLEVSEGKLPAKGPGILPYVGERMPEITIQVGEHAASCHLDSGSPGGFMLPTKLVESLPRKGEPTLLGKARTVNSEFEIWNVQLEATIVVAGNEYVDPTVGYSEILPGAIIGYQILKDLELTIDQRSRRVRIVPSTAQEEPAPPAEPAPRRRLGAGIALRGDVLTVTQVLPDSPAAAAGLRAGDVLARIDGEPVTRERLEAALTGTGVVRLEVQRGDEVVELRLFDE